MYSPFSSVDNRVDYKNFRHNARLNQNNYRIINEVNVDNKIGIEIEFTKNNNEFDTLHTVSKTECNTGARDFIRDGYNNSFQQKYT